MPAEIYDRFNTGATMSQIIQNIINWGYPWGGAANAQYANYAPARPYTKYCYCQSCMSIRSDGSRFYSSASSTISGYVELTPAFLDAVFAAGFVPIIHEWLCNIEGPDGFGNPTVTQDMLRAYLKNLSATLGNRQVIWCFAWEFNQVWGTWGTRGNGASGSWRLSPETFNRVMQWCRDILDSEGIQNILLGAHLVDFGPTNSVTTLINDYLAGLRVADVLGSSFYDGANTVDRCNQSWAQVNTAWQLIGTGAPWFFFEYGILPWGNTYPAEVVNRSYQLTSVYSFVKCMVWYNSENSMNSAFSNAVAQNAEQYNQGGSYLIGPAPPPPPTTITLTVQTTTGGTTNPSGAGTYEVGSTLQITATPDTGYEFDHWTLDGNPYPDTSPTLTLNLISYFDGITFTAYFKEQEAPPPPVDCSTSADCESKYGTAPENYKWTCLDGQCVLEKKTKLACTIGPLGVPVSVLRLLWRLREKVISKEVHKKLHPLV